MRNLLLTGFMGTGKTTVGREMARMFGLRFLDMDEEVERRAGRSIAEIFAGDSEAEFRRLESAVLGDLLRRDNQVIATGGGTLVSKRNHATLQSGDVVVCLTCDPHEILRRLDGGAERPLIAGRKLDGVLSLLEERRPAYQRFPSVDTTGRPPAEIAEEVGHTLDVHHVGTLPFDRRQESVLYFEAGLLNRAGSALRSIDCAADILLVYDDVIQGLGIAEQVATAIEGEGFVVHHAIVPSGERHKTLDTLRGLYQVCQAAGLDRQATVVGLGGGVIGDLAGMLAATYLRGLRLVLIPTTLLAQVDAAIGGKVAVDLDGAKNMIGAFHPAELILVDPCVLRSLPPRRVAEGLAEIVKIALVRSRDLLDAIEVLEGPQEVLTHSFILRLAAEEKLRVVLLDPYERGERAMLNFGHTIGHGLEAASGYQLSHGEAVSVGMVWETWLAETLGLCEPGLGQRLRPLLSRFALPATAPGLDPDRVLGFLLQDKKRRGRELRFALPTAAGHGAVVPVPEWNVKAAIAHAVGAAG